MYYRDIVFLFKYLMSPTPDALPEVKPYFQKDARLLWSFKEGEGFSVQGFGRQLKCMYPFSYGENNLRAMQGPS